MRITDTAEIGTETLSFMCARLDNFMLIAFVPQYNVRIGDVEYAVVTGDTGSVNFLFDY